MWVLTKTEWPTLVNLAAISSVGYQQMVKYDPRTRVVATTWEQELPLAECATAEQARALVRFLAGALAEGRDVLDLAAIDLDQLPAE